MEPVITEQWQQMALYAVGAALLLLILQRIPFIGRIVRFGISLALLSFCLFLLLQQAPYEPTLGRISDRLGLDSQQVAGDEVRIRMAANGHFMADVTINGVPRRMLIDSGATVTAISPATATSASVEAGDNLTPVILQTANGPTAAQTGTIDELRLGNITASNLKVVISPGLGNMNVLGMNFLSKLRSWRVEGRTLILVAENPEATP